MALTINLNFLTIDGLTLYESILLILGFVLFVVMLAGMILNMKSGMKKFIPFIILSIIMIGYSSIKKISFDSTMLKTKIEIEKCLQNPSDVEAKNGVRKMVSKIDPGTVRLSGNLTLLATANTLLGNYEKGIIYADKALLKNPESKQAKETKILAETSMAINTLASNSDDIHAVNNIDKRVKELEKIPVKNNFTNLTIANAYLLTGKTAEAKKTARTILSKNTGDKNAKEIIQLAMVVESVRMVKEKPTDNVALSNVSGHIDSVKANTSNSIIRSAVMTRAFHSLGNENMKQKYADSTRLYIHRQR
jgi:tetratricopeptide (TPR) repeat protein